MTSSLQNAHQVKTFKRRWFQLASLSCISCLQSMIWSTPISLPSGFQELYNVSGNSIQLWINILVGVGPLGSLPTIPITSWMLEKKGLRWTTNTGALLLVLATALRIISFKDWAIYLVLLAQTINALAAPFVISTCPKLSLVWFAENERNTATAIASLAQSFGGTVGFALSSFLYKIYSDEPEKALICVYRIEFYLAVGFFLVCLIGFATRPPSPPSSLAAMGNLWERAGVPSPRNSTANLISRCFKNKTFSIVVIPSSLAVAAWINWSNSFTLILHSYGKAEDFSGALASFTTLISIGGGILIARIADIFHFTRSSIIVLMSIMGSIGSLWFALTVQFISSDLTISSVCLFLSAGLVGLTAGASFPLFYEEAAAIAYPISSGITSGIFLFTMSIFMTGGFVLGALGPQNESYFTYVHAVLWLITAVMVWIFHDHVDRDFESQAIIEAIRTNGRFTYDFSFIEEIFEKQELLLDSDYISEED